MPHTLKFQAVEQLLLRDRAVEEVELIRTDIRNGVIFFCKQHEALSSAAESTDDARWRALLLRAIQKLQITMVSFWCAAAQYVSDICVMPCVYVSGTALHELADTYDGPHSPCENDDVCCVSDDDLDSDGGDGE